ncbi:MAG: hypothetical protein QXP98_03535 [Thermoproteus sp.]
MIEIIHLMLNKYGLDKCFEIAHKIAIAHHVLDYFKDYLVLFGIKNAKKAMNEAINYVYNNSGRDDLVIRVGSLMQNYLDDILRQIHGEVNALQNGTLEIRNLLVAVVLLTKMKYRNCTEVLEINGISQPNLETGIKILIKKLQSGYNIYLKYCRDISGYVFLGHIEAKNKEELRSELFKRLKAILRSYNIDVDGEQFYGELKKRVEELKGKGIPDRYVNEFVKFATKYIDELLNNLSWINLWFVGFNAPNISELRRLIPQLVDNISKYYQNIYKDVIEELNVLEELALRRLMTSCGD